MTAGQANRIIQLLEQILTAVSKPPAKDNRQLLAETSFLFQGCTCSKNYEGNNPFCDCQLEDY